MSTDLRTRRVACGLSQEDLAALSDVSASTVRNMEKGRVGVPRLREKVEEALRGVESGQNVPTLCGPALLYLGADGGSHLIDAEDFDLATLSSRDRTLCLALLAHTSERFAAGPKGGN